jgi:hypothetical protein
MERVTLDRALLAILYTFFLPSGHLQVHTFGFYM